MPTALITHPACLQHQPGAWHPERPDRLKAVLRALEDERFARLLREPAPEASALQLTRAHPADYVEAILAIRPEPGEPLALDADTLMSEGSRSAALHAAGGAVSAVDAVMSGRLRAAFVAVRPPGHHAESSRAMGFCLFNNAAVAALHARAEWGTSRVAVVDFDVHHGNGTQAILGPDPDFFYASSHQDPCYPGTGKSWERGVAGNVVNAPLPPGTEGPAFRSAWREVILPALRAFGPDLVIVSAGFDAHRADPLAQLRLDASDFVWLTGELVSAADQHSQGRIVSVLEGGYDLAALATSAAAHVGALMRLEQSCSW